MPPLLVAPDRALPRVQVVVHGRPLLISPVADLLVRLLLLLVAAAVRLPSPAHLPQGDDAHPATPVRLQDGTSVRIVQGTAVVPHRGDVATRLARYAPRAALALPHAMASVADVLQVPAQVVGTNDAVHRVPFHELPLVSMACATRAVALPRRGWISTNPRSASAHWILISLRTAGVN